MHYIPYLPKISKIEHINIQNIYSENLFESDNFIQSH